MHNYSSQPLPDTPLARLSLAKFSHVTTSLSHRGPLNWGHIIGNNDLTATFEKPRATNSLSGDSIVLRIFRFHDIMEELDLSFFAMAATKTPSQPAQGQASKPSFAVVVKRPCLAVKYPRGNMIRRFQIKFSAEKDYYAALAILSEINCPFSEASPAPMHKQTSSQWNTGSFRPSSMSSEPTVPNTIIPPNNGVGFPVYAPGTYARLPTPSVTAGTSITSASSSTLGTSHQYQATSTPSSLAKYMYTDSNRTQSLNGQCPPSALQVHGTSEADPSRPSTATLPLETANLDPPPVRVLPFSRPLMKRTHTIATTGIPAGNVAAFGSTVSRPYPELAPANKTQPTPSPHPPTQAETPRITVLKYSNPAAQVPAPAANPGGSQPVPRVPLPPLPSYSGLITTASNEQQPATSCDQHQKHYPLESVINNIPTITTAGAPQQEPLQEQQQQQTQQQQTIPLPTPEDLASYSSASTTERMQLVESWICRHVKDDAFLKLCEDVEGIWQRMKLGTGKGGT